MEDNSTRTNKDLWVGDLSRHSGVDGESKNRVWNAMVLDSKTEVNGHCMSMADPVVGMRNRTC